MRHDGKALDVVDARRQCEETALLDEGRLHARPARLALDGADESRALAADVSARA